MIMSDNSINILGINDGHNGSVALLKNGKLVCFYTYECDLGDGWEDADIHQNSIEKRDQAFKMGANIIDFVMTNN